MTQTIANRYELGIELGQGGMGTVYKGRDTHTENTVAIKVLKPDLTDVNHLERFRREGDALRELNHPNIVKMLDTIDENNQHYLIMEYVGGGDLHHMLEDKQRLSVANTLEIALDLADALTRAHRLKIIHRDLKPANVLLGDDGTPRLTDFGVAHFAEAEPVTAADALIGTPHYLAPEVLKGETIDPRADIWAFGVMLFEMIAGQRPFLGDSVAQVLTAILSQPIEDLEALCPNAPDGLIDLIYRMLDKDRNARISSIRLVGAELEAIMQGVTIDTSTIVVQGAPPPTRFATPTPMTGDAKHNLPAQTTAFIGREAEQSQLIRLLEKDEIRLVSILAPGGMGKTRLSLEVAQRFVDSNTPQTQFSDGVYFVELAPLTAPDQIVPAIAETLNMQIAEGPVPASAQLVQFLSDRQHLFIIDNCEHVIEGAGIIADILRDAPGVKILATSRIKLNLSGETTFHLGGMDFPDWETPEDALRYGAVQLFMQSARRVRPDFELQQEDLVYVARICRYVQGLPLGILLAAAWLDALSLEEIASEINASADVLETQLRDVPERQRSIRALYEYSTRLLPEKERNILARLAVFRGGFTREAAQKIVGASIRNLLQLVDHSLLQRDADSGRYSIHELLREYAQEALENIGEYDKTRAAHAAYFAGQFPPVKSQWPIQAVQDLIALGKQEWDNIRAAWMWLVDHEELDRLFNMVTGIHGFAMMTLRLHNEQEAFAYAESKFGVPVEEAQHAVQRRIYILNFQHDPQGIEHGVQRLHRALPVLEAVGDQDAAVWVRFVLGCVDFMMLRQYDTAIEKLMGGLRYYEENPNPSVMVPPLGDMLRFITMGYAFAGQFDLSMDYAHRTLNTHDSSNIFHAIDGYLFAIYLSLAQGYITGDLEPLEPLIQEAHKLMNQFDDVVRQMLLVPYEGTIALLKGQVDVAGECARKTIEISRQRNFLDALRRGVVLQGEIALYRGDMDAARENYGIAQNIPISILEFSEMDWGLTILAIADGAYRQAGQTLYRHLEGQPAALIAPSLTTPAHYPQKFGEEGYFARGILHMIAAIQAGLGHLQSAAELLGKLSLRAPQSGHWAEKLAIFADLPQHLKDELGDAAYQSAFEHGKSIDLMATIQAWLADFKP